MIDRFGWGDRMNEKFFDLKKEKQDRMINAALKIFALNGYAHASTDDIVKEAGISKGLLFHYFTNKIGLYSFIYDYSNKYMSIELTGAVDLSDNDYFGIHMQIAEAKLGVMKSYPYMVAFMSSTEKEDVIEALNEISDKRHVIDEKLKEFFAHANTSHIKDGTDIEKMDRIVKFVSDGLLFEKMREGDEQAESWYRELKKYIVELKNIACK